MPLFLVVHKVSQVTAKVSFAIIQLQDAIKTKQLPDGFKCRHIFPTSGELSMSVWDSPNGDQTVLLNWMTEHMNADCSHEILEIQEAFAYGLGEITRARATEKVSAGTAQMADRTAKAVKDFDTKMRISERTGHAVDAVSQSSVVQSTGAALTKAGSSVKNATMKVMEQPAVANAAESVGTGFRKLTASLSSMVGGRPPNPADVPHATTADP